MTDALRDAAAMVFAFLDEYESSDMIAGYAACPECYTVFAGFRIHSEECSVGRAVDAAKLLCEHFGGDKRDGYRNLVRE